MRLSIPIYIALLLLFSSIHGATIEVQLDEPPTVGTVICLLYNSANTFGDLREAYRQESFAITSENQYRLADIPAGTYALEVALQDRAGTNPTTQPLLPLHLGIAGRGDDGWYAISEVTVE